MTGASSAPRSTPSEDDGRYPDTSAIGQRGAAGRTPHGARLVELGWVGWLPPALVILGIGLRLRQYVTRRSLWNDEAALALNVVRRGYGELVKPLDIDQGAPLGFLWAQRTAVNLLGNNELALRFVPLLSGTAAVILFAVLARRLLTPWAVPAAVMLFATLGPLVYYSTEAKQYSVDVLVTVLLVLATVRFLDGPLSSRRAATWGALGVVCMLFSHPSMLVLAACWLTAGVVIAVRHGPRALSSLAPGVAVWIIGLGLLYLVSLRHLAANPSLEAFWKDGYAPQPLRVGTALPWIADVVGGLVPNPIELTAPALVLILMAVGTGALLLRHPPAGVLVVAIVAAALAAGLVAVYPMKWRLALYLVPVVLLALGASIDAVHRGKGASVVARALAFAALAVVAVSPIRESAQAAVHPYTVTEVRTVLAHVKATLEPADAVYVHWTAAVLYDYYAPVLGLPARTGFFSFSRPDVCSVDDPVRALRDHSRVWVVFAFPPMYEPSDDAETSLSQFDRLGPRIDARSAPGRTQAVLYDTSGDPSGAAPGRFPRPGDCFTVAREPP